MTCQQARMQVEDGNLKSKLQRTLDKSVNARFWFDDFQSALYSRAGYTDHAFGQILKKSSRSVLWESGG